MGVSFSTHSADRNLIKVYQCYIIKRTNWGSTWD